MQNDVSSPLIGSFDEVEPVSLPLFIRPDSTISVPSLRSEHHRHTVHRATATIALLLYCAPGWATSVAPLLEVVEASPKLTQKAAKLRDNAKHVAIASGETANGAADKGKLDDVCKLLDVSARLAGAAS